MNERSFLIALLGAGLLFLIPGARLEVPFAYDPLGPKAFPLGLGGALILLSLVSLPGAASQILVLQPRVLRLAGAVLFYLVAFHSLGFMPATALTVYLIARSVGCSWMQGLLTGMIIAISFYGIFHLLLGVPLPLGEIFRVLG